MCRWCEDLAYQQKRVARLAEIADDLRAEGFESDASKLDAQKLLASNDVKTFERWVRHEHSAVR